jgi:hypothetical protein
LAAQKELFKLRLICGEELRAVEMNHVVRIIRSPYFGIPCNAADMPFELSKIRKSADVYLLRSAIF